MPTHKFIPDKSQVPIVLAVIKNDENQVLIAQRNDPTVLTMHEKWELVGGRLEWDETPEQAVVREAKEESGLDIVVVRLLSKVFTNYWTQSDGTQFKVLLMPYECKIMGGELHTSNHDPKISQLKFID